MSPEMVKKEIWMHLLAYNVIRGVMARAAEAARSTAAELSVKGPRHTMTAFQDALQRARPSERDHLMTEMLSALAHHRVGDRFGRVEPRANKRRPKPQKFLMQPRRKLASTCYRRLNGKPSANPN